MDAYLPEIATHSGMSYGGMPHDVLLRKYELTDPRAVDAVGGYDELHTPEEAIDDYIRSEIIDRTPDTPWLESDQPRDNSTNSRRILNLHYTGTPGGNPELPRHPEMFIGFTGDDPRGSVNVPRFDKLRDHLNARAPNLTARMGRNADYHEAERPWTGVSIDMARQETNRRMRDLGYLRWFGHQREGRDNVRAHVLTPRHEVAKRYTLRDAADEPLRAHALYAPAREAMAADPRSSDRGRVAGGVQRTARLAQASAPEALFAASKNSDKSRNRNILASMDAALAAHRNARVNVLQDAEASAHSRLNGAAASGRLFTGAQGAPTGQDIVAAAQLAVEDAVKPADVGALGGGETAAAAGAGLVPGSDPGAAAWKTRADGETAANAVLHDIAAAMGAGLVDRGGAVRRRVARSVQRDGARPSDYGALDGESRGVMVGAHLTPASDIRRAAQQARATLIGTGAAEKKTANYRGLRPVRAPHYARVVAEEMAARHGRHSDAATNAASKRGAPVRRGGAGDERGHIGARASQTFGVDAFRRRETGIRGGAPSAAAPGRGSIEDDGGRIGASETLFDTDALLM